MVTTITALVTIMTVVQVWMPQFGAGRSWAFDVSTKITDAQLTAAKAPCCEYLRTLDGVIFRAGSTVYLLKQP